MAKAKRIIALGPREEMACLRAAGVQLVPLGPEADLMEPLRKHALDASVGLILVSETLAKAKMRAISELRLETGAVVLVVPGPGGSADSTLAFMKYMVGRSIGVDLISKG